MTELVRGIRSDQACISRENCQKEKVMRQLSSFWWLSCSSLRCSIFEIVTAHRSIQNGWFHGRRYVSMIQWKA